MHDFLKLFGLWLSFLDLLLLDGWWFISLFSFFCGFGFGFLISLFLFFFLCVLVWLVFRLISFLFVHLLLLRQLVSSLGFLFHFCRLSFFWLANVYNRLGLI